MIARWLAISTVIILLLALAWHADPLAPDPITLSLSHYVGTSPAEFRVRVQIQPHPDNRGFCWSYDGPELRRSCRTLDGLASARTYTVWLKDVHAGEYGAMAELYRMTDGQPKTLRTAQVSFRVIGIF